MLLYEETDNNSDAESVLSKGVSASFNPNTRSNTRSRDADIAMR
jgi:hypothetical protein